MKHLGPFVYVGLVCLMSSIFGFLIYFHDGFFFETALWEISKVLLRDTLLWTSLFTGVSIYVILLFCLIFNKRVTL